MKLRLIRHATLMLELGGQRLLVDPMLAEPERYAALTLGGPKHRNPMVPLPCGLEELAPNALLITHRHFDHFDKTAQQHFSRALPLLCPEWDAAWHRRRGALNVFEVGAATMAWRGLQVSATRGRHGTGLVGWAMGQTAGLILRAPHEPTVYLAGDTVWCPEVASALAQHQPDVVVVNAGSARFDLGGPITMGAADVAAVARAVPEAIVVAVHMEALDHCRLSRQALAAALATEGLMDRVRIPVDGETLRFGERPVADAPGFKVDFLGPADAKRQP